MRRLDIEATEPGMTLASDVVDRRGRVLLPAGAELTARHARTLKMWGVMQVEVEGQATDEPGRASEVEPWALEAARREADERLGLVGADHPFLALLRDHYVERRAPVLQIAGRP